ncbi:hypothetical protein BCR35DRAFT_301657 [Leucosporidium creatinivorum]|uniref:PLAC8 family-domain-containing protein n=1 Tax=Leucosporidium creatinivorum TaxID=106004 RepID=A0A1Y2FWU0_9BASI|nr:hypothetical protein BCR35DRAFT_301657 [Leucosporidium creatinivorum]
MSSAAMSSPQQATSPDLHPIATTSTAPLVSGQPTAKESMSSSSHLQQQQQQDGAVEQGSKGGRAWSSGLRDFGNDGFPWKNLFCPCAGYILNKGKYEELPASNYKPYSGEDAQIPSWRDCMEMTLHVTTGCLVGFEALQRRTVRERLGIAGSPLQDLALSCCCMSCSQAQQRRELDHELGTTRNQSWDEKQREHV